MGLSRKGRGKTIAEIVQQHHFNLGWTCLSTNSNFISLSIIIRFPDMILPLSLAMRLNYCAKTMLADQPQHPSIITSQKESTPSQTYISAYSELSQHQINQPIFHAKSSCPLSQIS